MTNRIHVLVPMLLKTWGLLSFVVCLIFQGSAQNPSEQKPYSQNGETLRRQISVTEFGARGDGLSDCSEAFAQALKYLKNNSLWQINNRNETPRGTGTLVVPAGIYRIDTSIRISNMNGLRVIGEGIENSIIVYTSPTGSLFEATQIINFSMKNLSMENGIVQTAPSGKKYIESLESSNAVGFKWDGKYGDRFIRFDRVGCRTGFQYVWHFGSKHGDQNHSEASFWNCIILGAQNVIKLDNAQSVNHAFYDCHFERISEAVFHLKRGGYVHIYGGSMINKGDFFRFEPSRGGIGRYNNVFTITNTKFEMWENLDPGATPKIIHCITPTHAKIIFNNVSNDAAANPEKIYFDIKGSVDLIFNDCNITGRFFVREKIHERKFAHLDMGRVWFNRGRLKGDIDCPDEYGVIFNDVIKR